MPESLGYRLGVGIVLVNEQHLVFAGHRRDGREFPWQMPQGGVQMGEEPTEAAFRELHEELGTNRAEVAAVFPRWQSYDYPPGFVSRRARLFRGQRHCWFLMRFSGKDNDIRVATSHCEFSHWRWMEPREVIDLAIPFKQPVYREVLNYFLPATGHHHLRWDGRRELSSPVFGASHRQA